MPAIHIALSLCITTSVIGYFVIQHMKMRQLLRERLENISNLVHGSPISISKTKESRFVVLRSERCKSTSITMDLLQFHEAVAIAERYVHLHGKGKCEGQS
jgi:hypothetical protein